MLLNRQYRTTERIGTADLFNESCCGVNTLAGALASSCGCVGIGLPHDDENDPEAEADEEEQWARPEHDLWPRNSAIASVAPQRLFLFDRIAAPRPRAGCAGLERARSVCAAALPRLPPSLFMINARERCRRSWRTGPSDCLRTERRGSSS